MSTTSIPVIPARSPRLVLGVLLVAIAVGTAELTAVFNAIPELIVAMHATPASISWIVTAYLLTMSVSAAVCGRLGDIYGRRKVLIIVLVIAAIGSLVSLATGSLIGLTFGRGLQGFSGAALPLCLGIAREALPSARIHIANAVLSGGATIAAAAGGLIGGMLVDSGGWRAVFIFTGGLAAVAAAGCLALPSSGPAAHRPPIDYLGVVVFVPAIALILCGITQSSVWGWADSGTVALLGGGIAVLCGWLYWELRVAHPIINVRVVRDRRLALAYLTFVILGFGPVALVGFVFPIILQSPTTAPVGLGLSATAAGVVSLASNATGFALSPWSGRLSMLFGARVPVMIGAALTTVGAVSASMALHSLAGIWVSMILLGAGIGFIVSGSVNLVAEVVPTHRISEAVGVSQFIQAVFSAIATSIAGMLLVSAAAAPGVPAYGPVGFIKVLALMGLACTTAFVVLAVVPNRRTAEAGTTVEPQR